ncbi:MAG TPA: hypothetical protein VGJ60_07150 [Chloroflexota bacterium]
MTGLDLDLDALAGAALVGVEGDVRPGVAIAQVERDARAVALVEAQAVAGGGEARVGQAGGRCPRGGSRWLAGS